MGRPSNKTERRQQIAHALLTVMAEKGYETATITEISKAAGLTSGLIHYHFKNKQEILTEAISILANAAKVRYELKVQNKVSPKEKLNAFIDATLALGDSAKVNIVAAWVVVGAESVRQVEVRKLYRDIVKEHLDNLQNLIKEYCESVGIKKPHNEIYEIACMSIACIEGLYQLASTTKDLLPVGFAAANMKKMLFASLHE